MGTKTQIWCKYRVETKMVFKPKILVTHINLDWNFEFQTNPPKAENEISPLVCVGLPGFCQVKFWTVVLTWLVYVYTMAWWFFIFL